MGSSEIGSTIFTLVESSEKDDLLTTVSDKVNLAPLTTTTCVWYRFTISVLISGCLSLIGILGNTLAFSAMLPDRKKSATAVLLLALAVVDSLILIIRLMMKTVPVLLEYAQTADGFLRFQKSYMRSYVWTLNSMLDTANTWIVVAVTVQRFIAVCKPLQAHTMASVSLVTKQIVCISFGALVFNIPRAFEFHVVKTAVNGTSEFTLSRQRTALGMTFSFQYVYKVIIFYLIMYVIPLTILIILTSKLMKAIRMTTEKRLQMTGAGSTRKQKEDRDVTISLVAVIIVFVVCQLSEPIRRTLAAQLGGNENNCGTIYFYYHDVHNFATVFNSSVNFIIYCVCGPSFRRKVRKMLCPSNVVGPEGNSTATSQTPGQSTQVT